MKPSDFEFSCESFWAPGLMNVWECVLGLDYIPTEWEWEIWEIKWKQMQYCEFLAMWLKDLK